VVAYDPVAGDEAVRHLGEMERFNLAPDMHSAAAGSDALILLTEWKEFRAPDMGRLKSELRSPVIFDGRNVFDLSSVRRLGFQYYGIGRQATN
jgi:UDPglucose 6-dehydrogenase